MSRWAWKGFCYSSSPQWWELLQRYGQNSHNDLSSKNFHLLTSSVGLLSVRLKAQFWKHPDLYSSGSLNFAFKHQPGEHLG